MLITVGTASAINQDKGSYCDALDSELHVARSFLGLALGGAHILTPIFGGRVTEDMIRSANISQRQLGHEIVVCIIQTAGTTFKNEEFGYLHKEPTGSRCQ